MYSARVEAAALPAMIDLRPQCPAVYDQGQLGSCTGNAWAGMVEFLFLKQGLTDFTPSRLFIYYNERVIDGDGSISAHTRSATARVLLGSCPDRRGPPGRLHRAHRRSRGSG
jgi:hypothetical protein